MRLICHAASTCLILASLGLGPHVLAQEEPAAPPAEAEPSAQEPAASAEPAEEPAAEKKEFHFGLYVEAAYGNQDADDIATGIRTLSTHTAESYLTMEEQDYVRAAVGWQLPHGKGDFRLRFDAWDDTKYNFTSVGRQRSIDPSLPNAASLLVTGNLDWWNIVIEDGELHAARTPPQWIAADDDANEDGAVDPEEVRYDLVDLEHTVPVAKDLDNRAQIIDLLYGRTFGGRRFSARWWCGLRYFTYEGNLKASGWLLTTLNGNGFTDGALMPLIDFRSDASGGGPTGILEADFNFFDQRLQLYMLGQVAFMMTSLSTDTGLFSTLIRTSTPGAGTVYVPIDARLSESRDKSTWQNAAEVGARIKLKSGLQFELAYNATGLLDVILLPNQIQIPEKIVEAPQGTSGQYKTQDYVLDGWRFGVAFQF